MWKDNENPILREYIRKFLRASKPKLPEITKADLEKTALEVQNTVPIIKAAYPVIKTQRTYPNSIRVMEQEQFDKRYNLLKKGKIGTYMPHRDEIDLKDGDVLQVLSIGFHELGERDLGKPPMSKLSYLTGIKPDQYGIIRSPEAARTSHNIANSVQILLTEKAEKTGKFYGQLRRKTKELLSKAAKVESEFTLEYMNLNGTHNFKRLADKYLKSQATR